MSTPTARRPGIRRVLEDVRNKEESSSTYPDVQYIYQGGEIKFLDKRRRKSLWVSSGSKGSIFGANTAAKK